MDGKYQDHEISGVKFEDTGYQAVKYYRETNTPKIIKLVMKYSGGSIKEENQASYVLIGFVVVAIVISLYLFFGGKSTQQKIPPAVLEQMKRMPINR